MDGTVNGELVGTKTAEPEEGACFEDSDCSGGAMCETWAEDVSRVLECQADGLDLVKAKVRCAKNHACKAFSMVKAQQVKLNIKLRLEFWNVMVQLNTLTASDCMCGRRGE
eukprot:1159765-Pelagomonas_calceolata.AAC.14